VPPWGDGGTKYHLLFGAQVQMLIFFVFNFVQCLHPDP
jgi:hypothetical protein